MIGIDLVENARFLNKSSEFIQRILSIKELEVYNSYKDELRKLTYLASRFASKEAIFKAVSSGNKDINYRDISVLNNNDGSPYVEIIKYPNYKFQISITHTKDYSQAVVLRTDCN